MISALLKTLERRGNHIANQWRGMVETMPHALTIVSAYGIIKRMEAKNRLIRDAIKKRLVWDALGHIAKPGYYEEACNARLCGGRTLLGRLLAGKYGVSSQVAEESVREALIIEESDQERFVKIALQMFSDNPALIDDARNAYTRYGEMAGHSLIGGQLMAGYDVRVWTIERALRRALAIYDGTKVD